MIALLIALTFVFWGWFYFFPENPVIQRIEEKSSFSLKHYKPSTEAASLSRIDDSFEISMTGEGVVMFEKSFIEPPVIHIYRSDDIAPFYDTKAIDAEDITTESFDYKVYSSGQHGVWQYRAIGKLFKEITP
jgi:hypothetical protein